MLVSPVSYLRIWFFTYSINILQAYLIETVKLSINNDFYVFIKDNNK